MQQRRASTAAAGRPQGTDGSDFSHRMRVESRYTKVADGKSRLQALIVAQALSQFIGSLWVFLSASQDNGLNNFSILSIAIGFISLIIGELGRRHSKVNLLRLYSSISSVATAFSVACMVRSDLFFKVIHDWNFATIYELVEVSRVLLGVVLQVFIIITTITLLQNMSIKRSA